MKTFVYTCAVLSLSLGALATHGVTYAETFPERPIRLILPASAGGGGDAFGRMLADRIGKRLRQSIVVENNPGASGTIGMSQLAHAKPDGYTIGLGTFSSIALAPTVFPTLPYNPNTDFTTLARVGTAPIILVVRNDFPAKTLKEFEVLARKSAEPVQYGSWGMGSTGNFCAEVLAQKTGIKLDHVPFNGSAAVANALLGGHINVAWLDIGSGTAVVQSGKVRALAMCTRPTANFPNVGTYKDQGVDFDEWTGWAMYGPANLPKPIAKTLEDAIRSTLEEPEVKKQMLGWGITPDFVEGEKQADITKKSIEIWKQIALDAGMKFK